MNKTKPLKRISINFKNKIEFPSLLNSDFIIGIIKYSLVSVLQNPDGKWILIRKIETTQNRNLDFKENNSIYKVSLQTQFFLYF